MGELYNNEYCANFMKLYILISIATMASVSIFQTLALYLKHRHDSLSNSVEENKRYVIFTILQLFDTYHSITVISNKFLSFVVE